MKLPCFRFFVLKKKIAVCLLCNFLWGAALSDATRPLSLRVCVCLDATPWGREIVYTNRDVTFWCLQSDTWTLNTSIYTGGGGHWLHLQCRAVLRHCFLFSPWPWPCLWLWIFLVHCTKWSCCPDVKLRSKSWIQTRNNLLQADKKQMQSVQNGKQWQFHIVKMVQWNNAERFRDLNARQLTLVHLQVSTLPHRSCIWREKETRNGQPTPVSLCLPDVRDFVSNAK